MSPAQAIAIVLAVTVLITGRRLWRHARLRGWSARICALLLVLHAGSTALLWLGLFPPPASAPSPLLEIMTARAEPFTPSPGSALIVLPEAPSTVSGERVADLATALRAHPGSTQARVHGAGLAARDLDAARAVEIDFEAAPLPRGLVELYVPERVRSGARWRLDGRVNALAGAQIEVLDPAGTRVARAAADAAGGFQLTLTAPMAGRARFGLRIRDPTGALVEELALPLLVEPAQSARVLLLEGGVGPENKYFKRWAIDAGIDLRSELRLRPGARLLAKAPSLDAAALESLDLLVLDERAFFALDAGARSRVLAAVEDGLGLLLRVTGPLTDAQRVQLARLGFAVADADIARSVTLAEASALAATAVAGKSEADQATTAITLTRRALNVSSNDALPLLLDAKGTPLALWRAHSNGRIALWWLSDSYKLVLAGDPAAHGSLWSEAVSVLGRARSPLRPRLADAHPRVDNRQSLCGLDTDAAMVDKAGTATPLLRDPRAGNCAAWWPQSPGWHRLANSAGSSEWFVRGPDEAPGLAAHALRAATLELASAARAPAAALDVEMAASPWPWFAAWLAVSALLWWLERRRLGEPETRDGGG